MTKKKGIAFKLRDAKYWQEGGQGDFYVEYEGTPRKFKLIVVAGKGPEMTMKLDEAPEIHSAQADKKMIYHAIFKVTGSCRFKVIAQSARLQYEEKDFHQLNIDNGHIELDGIPFNQEKDEWILDKTHELFKELANTDPTLEQTARKPTPKAAVKEEEAAEEEEEEEEEETPVEESEKKAVKEETEAIVEDQKEEKAEPVPLEGISAVEDEIEEQPEAEEKASEEETEVTVEDQKEEKAEPVPLEGISAVEEEIEEQPEAEPAADEDEESLSEDQIAALTARIRDVTVNAEKLFKALAGSPIGKAEAIETAELRKFTQMEYGETLRRKTIEFLTTMKGGNWISEFETEMLTKFILGLRKSISKELRRDVAQNLQPVVDALYSILHTVGVMCMAGESVDDCVAVFENDHVAKIEELIEILRRSQFTAKKSMLVGDLNDEKALYVDELMDFMRPLESDISSPPVAEE